jgi:hypothetical protein
MDRFPSFGLGTSASVYIDCFNQNINVARHDNHANADPGAELGRWAIRACVPDLNAAYVLGFSEDIGRLVFINHNKWDNLIVVDFSPQPPCSTCS